MGFLDKAKKMAEQAQAKLDEAQQQFNSSPSGGTQAGGPVAEYDKHGRPIPQEPSASPSPPQGDPLGAGSARPPAPQPPAAPTPGVPPTGQGDPLGAAAAAPAPPPVAQPGVPPTGAAPVAPPAAPPMPAAPPDAAPAGADADAAAPGSAGVPEDRNKADYAPPKLSSGDPLAG